MAQVIEGRSRCALCNKVIDSVGGAVAFPAFIPSHHRLARFSDSVFHRECFDEWSERGALQDLYERYQVIWKSRPENLKTAAEIEAWGRNAFRELFDEEQAGKRT